MTGGNKRQFNNQPVGREYDGYDVTKSRVLIAFTSGQ